MVAVEAGSGTQDEKLALKQKLENHYMLDSVTAQELALAMPQEGTDEVNNVLEYVENDVEAVVRRDLNRQEVQQIFSGESDKQLIILGPCSLDADTDYTELFDYLEELQIEHTNSVIGVRLNGAKPRTKGGNTGLFPSTIPGSRRKQLDAYEDAFRRGIPIFTEVTEKDQFAVLAPYLTGAWIGARDMGSTDLRTFFSATRLPVMVKNSTDGKLSSLQNAVIAIGSNTEANNGSGVNLGYLASTCRHEDGGPATFTVGQGNQHVAIVARGYDLDEERFVDGELKMVKNDMSDEEREAKAVEYLSDFCHLASIVQCVALLDGSHEVPRMFAIDKTEGNRFLEVMRRFRKASQEGRIQKAHLIRGYLGEVSVNEGTTDKNLVLTAGTKLGIAEEIKAFGSAWKGWQQAF